MQHLLSLRPVVSRNDAVGLRGLYNSITSCCRSLTALHIPTHYYYVMLKSILLRCLPAELRVEYFRLGCETSKEDSSTETTDGDDQHSSSTTMHIGDEQVKNIMRFLKREVESLEKSKAASITPSVNTQHSSSHTTAASLMSSSAKSACVFCSSDGHATKDCDSKMSISEKREILRKTARCFRCANRGHSSKKCRSSKWISCLKCKGKHLTSLCDPSYIGSKSTTSKTSDSTMQSATSLCAHNLCMEGKNVFLKTARGIATATSGRKSLCIRFVIDGGSQFTFIRRDLVQRLNLSSVGEVNLSVMPFGSKEQTPFQKCKKVEICIKSQFLEESVILEAIVVPEICVDALPMPGTSCSWFNNLRLADSHNTNVEAKDVLSLLIGSDYYWSVVTGKQEQISAGIRAVETIFGWTVQGAYRSGKNFESQSHSCSLFVRSVVLNLPTLSSFDPTAFWSLETLGIRGDQAENEQLDSELINKCIARNGQRYVASLPWINPDVEIKSNKEIALKRLKCLTMRLLRCPEQFNQYDSGIRQLVADGVAESVPMSTESDCQRTFYLPHRPVYKESTTTRQRIVFDASARTEDTPSLNDLLHVGANLLPDVLKILLNFRLGRFGAVADIEKAFLQILLNEKDRDSHRFFWYAPFKTPMTGNPEIAEYRMTRVTFGINCSPFLLTATLRTHFSTSTKYTSTCHILLDSFYMDDLAISFDEEEEGKRICEEAVLVLKGAKMNLRKWNSSSELVRKSLCPGESLCMQKVLGLSWYVRSDELVVPLDSVEGLLTSKLLRGTKRNVLQTIARIYDPLGMLGPVVIKLRILFQAAWKENLSWDQVLPSELLREWEACVHDLLLLKDYSISRSVFSFPCSSLIHVHIFSDASMKAYGTVAFIKSFNDLGECKTKFLCSKNRVAPLKVDGTKELSLPKMELTAALLAARLCSYLKRTLKINVSEFHLWTDSRIALGWIQGNTQRWKPYVQGRVTEIRRLTSAADWKHCRGKENPADLITRGITARNLQSSSIWTNGPGWLQSDVRFEQDIHKDDLGPVALIAQVTAVAKTSPVPFIDFLRFSSWTRLLRVTAYSFRFIRLKKVGRPKFTELSAEELDTAENYWLKFIQAKSFKAEIDILKAQETIPKSSKMFQWCPFLDDNGILRLKGSLGFLDCSYDEKHPIILASDSYLVNLIIDFYHLMTLHGGTSVVLSQMRERFWIFKGRPLIKRRTKMCVTCQKLFGRPVSKPFGPLPLDRLTLSRPFDCVGIDFAGPLYYIDAATNTMTKCYLMLFTCAAIRSVHLELVTSLSTEHCLMGLRRFIARRGTPSTIYSDNARTFRRAAMELSETNPLLDDDRIQKFLSGKRIRWKFIVERAPWWGGFWERLVRTVKNVLKVVIKRAKLTYEQLETVIIEAEGIVNARPLTYMSSDPLDPTPLTPAHFIHGHGGVWDPQEKITSDKVQQLWSRRLKFIRMLSNRWRIEYVQLLRSFYTSQGHSSKQLKPDDVVLMFDSGKPRIAWKLAVIEEAYISRDGNVRACMLRFSDGSKLRRPVQLLYPIEIAGNGRGEDVKN